MLIYSLITLHKNLSFENLFFENISLLQCITNGGRFSYLYRGVIIGGNVDLNNILGKIILLTYLLIIA